MYKVLFICSQNRLRSPTAETIFGTWPNVEAQSTGLHHDAENPVTPEDLMWAEIIFVMEKGHKSKLSKKFGKYLRAKRIICLDIPDNYDYMDPTLVKLLETRVAPFLRS